MNKKYIHPEEANSYIKDEEAIISSFIINNDNTITAEVEIFLYLENGKTYSALRKIRLKNE